MKEKILKRFGTVLIIAIVAVTFAVPGKKFDGTWLGKQLGKNEITLGLDLAGGTELDYRIDLSQAIEQNNDDDTENNVNIETIAESVRDSLEARVNPAGVGEILVKRSQVDGEEHVLIQMPPSTSIEKAKADASRDNRLEFFEEDPDMEKALRLRYSVKLNSLTDANWDTKIEEWKTEETAVYKNINEGRFEDEIQDQKLAAKLMAVAPGTVLKELIETQTELEYTLGEDGNLEIKEFPKRIFGFARLTNKTNTEREKTVPEEAQAQHILFAYPGAIRAGEDVKYTDKETAKAEAEKILEQLKTEGTEKFAELAGEYSTEPGADKSGGSLGSFGKGQMAAPFEAAVFAKTDLGLIQEIVETDFGYHIIEVTSYQAEGKETVNEPKITYEIFGWDVTDGSWIQTKLGGAQLDVATVGYNELGQPTVDLLFNAEGGDLFAQLTDRVSKRTCTQSACRLGIKVGGNWQTQATVREKIIGRRAQITGNFTFQSAKALADGLNLGAIDAPVNLSGETTIRPDLGEEQLNKSLKAAGLGFLATIAFMLFSYKLGGIVAAVALALYAGLFITVLKIWPTALGGPIVLSLAGMAGIALSIGLAVDGNILIFERMKEELKRGKGLHQAVDLGFERAWSAIRDSNLTTLITCIILYNLGSSMIKGFAITLIVGTLLSMFTAITVSRTLLHTLLLNKAFQKPSLFGVKEIKKGKK
jgi:protein-export membrane protein SecD